MTDTQLLYFTASWCSPCRTYGPRLVQAAADIGLTLVKIDADEHEEMIAEFGIMSLPTVVVMSDGRPGERLIGAKGDAELRKSLKEYA